MRIEERTVAMAERAEASELGWFAVRQPGLLRFIENRLGHNEDALAMAIDLCWQVVSAFERQLGLPSPRILTSQLEQGLAEVVAESRPDMPVASPDTPRLANGCAHRQPELCRWLEVMMASPALPLENVVLDHVALIVAATISSCDLAHLPLPELVDEPTGLLVG